MKYDVTIAGRVFEVEVDGHAVCVGGRSATGRLMAVPGTPLVRLALDGRSTTFAMQRVPGGWQVSHAGRDFPVEVADERTRALRSTVGAPVRRPEGGLVKAPMPGLVVRLEVEVGQAVQAGTGLLVLEAMKMENEIRATVAGTVKRIMVSPRQTVDRGSELLEIETGQG